MITLSSLICCSLLSLQGISSANAVSVTGGAVHTLIVTFKYQGIETAARQSISSSPDALAASHAAIADAHAAYVHRYLLMTSASFSAEKRAVFGGYAGLKVIGDYPLLPVSLVRANSNQAAALAANPRVLSVVPARTYSVIFRMDGLHASSTNYPPDLRLIDDLTAQSSGDRGQGTSVAVLDDGTDYHRSAFGACTTLGSASCRVLAYRDFATPPKNGLSFTGHGTNVAAQVLKVAPQGKLIVGNVFHLAKSGKEAYSDATVIKGLNWVLSEAGTYEKNYPVRAVNLSLGNWYSYYTKSCASSPYAAVFSQLMKADIQPVLAAGNSAYEKGKFKNGVVFPACSPHALDVGAVYDQNIGKKAWESDTPGACTDKATAPDEMACFSQRGPLLGVVAPGVNETAAGITDTGTSQAAPLVSGAIAALASGARSVPSAQIAAAIESTGTPVADPHVGGTVPRLDVRAAELSLNASGPWQDAIEVPGAAALNSGGNAFINSVSCASAGNCSAGGNYYNAHGNQAFVVSQVNGTWHDAIEIPGTPALNTDGEAFVGSVSCASAGNCSVGGSYADANDHGQPFVVSQVNGTWHDAIEVPGFADLGEGGGVGSVSCASAGNCTAGGNYWDAYSHQQAYVVSQVNGVWQDAIEVPGSAALNTGGSAGVQSMSCVSAGNCSAGGFYWNGGFRAQAFVVSQVNGAWQSAIEVPGTAALNVAADAAVSSVSCASAGNCTAGGTYADASGNQQAFVVSQVNGAWQSAIEVPGTAALNIGGYAEVKSVSCASAGNCTAVGGYYSNASHDQQPFVALQVNGTWGTATEVPGIAALNTGGNSDLESVSCAPAGSCSAAGYYADASDHWQVFVVSQR